MNRIAVPPDSALPGKTALQRLARIFCCGLALLALPVAAGNFGVSPIRVELDRNAKTGAITVSNDDSEALRVQLRLFEWTQDATGKDEYHESEDLIYFPKLMILDKSEQKLVRVGLRIPATAQEKTYRLFVEELPGPPGEASGARVAIRVRFGVPIFLKPMKVEARGEIEKIEMAQGVLRVTVRNTGNAHFVINTITAASGDAYSKEVPGWYLLAGAVREHAIPVLQETCGELKRIDVTAKTDEFELKGALDVTAAMCAL
ncbi:MAG: fimbria/pilus periplasmic chaperone [Sulfuricaulis sp.]|uniref:fimbrial biogenesis chaperone n=1 Tax=Sulfuricaulis sp. TaxID=2003553 RepID=UPI0025F333B5|nr:fimbria/pilus periplasmic chaperone [Sulfuricaulis sp.]MCR4347461.1 fimbria/pilus periplasmic chaperone [Sulfuricaulis sp.]